MLPSITDVYAPGEERKLLDAPIRILHEPTPAWNYAHHPFLAWFKGRFFLYFSLGRNKEDDVGQRMMVMSSPDFAHWTQAREIAAPQRPDTGVVIASGPFESGERMNAYALQFDYSPQVLTDGSRGPGSRGRENWRFRCLTTTDGERFTETEAPAAFGGNMPVRALRSGRLFSCGGRVSAWTDDPEGLSGWREAAVFPRGWQSPEAEKEDHALLPGEVGNHSVDLCEGSFLELPDGELLMLLRSCTPWLWASRSRDGGETWTLPERTDFSDNRTKFFLGRLPDGRYYYIGTPDPFPPRTRHVLALYLSKDGMRFDTHYLLENRQFKGRYPGLDKNGVYGYPTALVRDGNLYVTFSINKEMIAVTSVSLSDL